MPKNPIPHDADTVCYETLARGILCGAMQEEFEDIELRDKPDLLCWPGNIGVEVTRVMYPHAGETSDFLQNFKGQTQEEIGEQKLARLSKNGYEPLFYQEKLIGISPKGMQLI